MSRLRDDAFLTATEEPTTTRRNWAALTGVGDAVRREVDDFITSFGANAEDGSAKYRTFTAGDTVEFSTPDGIRRTGSLSRQQGEQWLVEIDEGHYNLVPVDRLTHTAAKPVGAKRAALRQLLATTDDWVERESPVQFNNTDFRITLDYGLNSKMPSNDALCSYVERKYAARVLDAESVRPGVLRVVCTAVAAPSDPTSTDQPGTETEELEGTGKIGFVMSTLEHVAAANPAYDFVMGSVVEDAEAGTVTANFTMTTTTGDKLYLNRQGNITPVLDETCAPAVGQLTYDGKRVVGTLHAPEGAQALNAYGINVRAAVEPPYSSGTGPQGTREDYPGSAQSGDYVVKAEQQHDAAGAGEGYYTKDSWEREVGDYDQRMREEEERAKKNRLRQQQHRKQMEEAPPQDWMEASKDAAGGEADGDSRETIAQPGEIVASVDETAQDYWERYYGDYGEKLVSDVNCARCDKEMIRDIKAAWLMHQDRLPTDRELRVMAGILRQDPQYMPTFKHAGAQLMVHVAQAQMSMRDYINGLVELTQSDAQGAGASVGKAIARFVSKTPQAISDLGPTVLPQLLYRMAQDSQANKQLQQIFVQHQEKAKPQKMDLTDNSQQNAPTSGQPMSEGQQREMLDPNMIDLGGARAAKVAAGNRQPAKGDAAAMRPQVQKVTGNAGYLTFHLVWDPDCCEGMSTGNVRHQLVSFVKGLESRKDYRDYGYFGKVTLPEFDADLGFARARVRSSGSDTVPQEVIEVE